MSSNPNKVAVLSAAVAAIVIPFTTSFEGTVLYTYKDPVLGWAVPTACTGHTGSWKGKLLQRGQTWTREECAAMLTADAQVHYAGMMKCVTVSMTDNEQAAWLDFTINLGVSNFCNSTARKNLNAGDHIGACGQILQWKWVGAYDCFLPENSKVCGGVPRRRVAEYNLCTKGLT